MRLKIDRLRTRAELSKFTSLPRRLYEGVPSCVAPLDHERRQLLDPRKSSLFTQRVACYWTARRNGTAVDRVSAQIDFADAGADTREIGMFGCLDAFDDGKVVATLLRTAEDWLRERKCQSSADRPCYRLQRNLACLSKDNGSLQPRCSAIMLAIPNILDIMTDLGPAPGLLGWAKLLYRIWRQRYRRFQVVLVGLTSKYQNSILGSVTAGVAFAEERRRLRAKGVDLILGWVHEDTHP